MIGLNSTSLDAVLRVHPSTFQFQFQFQFTAICSFLHLLSDWLRAFQTYYVLRFCNGNNCD